MSSGDYRMPIKSAYPKLAQSTLMRIRCNDRPAKALIPYGGTVLVFFGKGFL